MPNISIPALLTDVAISTARFFIISVGLNLVLGVLGILNLTHGALVALGMYVAASAALAAYKALGPIPALIVMILASLAAGFAVGALLHTSLLRWLLDREDMEQLIATFAAFLIMEDVFKAVWGTRSYTAPLGLQNLFGVVNVGGVVYPGYQLFTIAAALAIGAVLYLILYRTRAGLVLRALMHEREVLQAYGARVGLYYALAVGLGAAITTVAGSVLFLGQSVEPGIAADFLATAFAIVVIGGLGSLPGTAVASFLAALADVLSTYFAPQLEKIAIYLLMLIVLAVRPEGLMGARRVRVA